MFEPVPVVDVVERPRRDVRGVPVVASRFGSAEFAERFGASSADVLAAMTAAGDDIASQAAPIALDLDGVGLVRRQVPVAMRNPFSPDETVNAICTVKVTAGVPVTKRGLHLSRIGHAVAESV